MHQSERFRFNSVDEQLDNLKILKKEHLVQTIGEIPSNITYLLAS